MYAPLAFITREAMVTRKVPQTDVTVEKGTRLVVPVRALHFDPQYWPNPDQYDPERFSEEQKKTRPSAVYLPFGDGPRICIGRAASTVKEKKPIIILSPITNYDKFETFV